MAANFWTAFFGALSDRKSYFKFQQEMNHKAVEELFFNSFKGKTSFPAIVLQANGVSEVTKKQNQIRVRPLDIHDFIIPEPCAPEIKSLSQRKAIIGLHPVAVNDSYTVEPAIDNVAPASPIVSGQIVECYFVDGPNNEGKLRGLRFRENTKANLSQSPIDLTCLTLSGDESLKSLFEAPMTPLSQMVTPNNVPLANASSNSTTEKNDRFVVDGVAFESVPATGAGDNAAALYASAESVGQYRRGNAPTKPPPNWEETPMGNAWIKENIYRAAGGEYAAKTYPPRLGKFVDRGDPYTESFWSSWFFSVVYKPWKDEGGWGSSHYDYGADEGLKRRKDVLASPDAFKGQIMWITFTLEEAPVYKGDSVYSHRKGGASGFEGIANRAPSHMRTLADDSGTIHGGNEGNSVGKGKLTLINQKVKPGSKYGKYSYVAVYKRVRVLGKAAGGITLEV